MNRKQLIEYLQTHEISVLDLVLLLTDTTIANVYTDLIKSNSTVSQPQTVTHPESESAIQCVLHTDSYPSSAFGSTTFIFTDGGCKGNGKANAKGGYGVFFTDNQDSEFYKFNRAIEIPKDQCPTNQKAELLGIDCAIQTIIDNPHLFNKFNKVCIVSDSMYSIKCITVWSKQWVKSGWKTSKGGEIKNLEIIRKIIDNTETIQNNLGIDLEFKHVMSHKSQPNVDSPDYILWYGNDRVDKMINSILV